MASQYVAERTKAEDHGVVNVDDCTGRKECHQYGYADKVSRHVVRGSRAAAGGCKTRG